MWNPIRAARERARRTRELEDRVRRQDELDARPINCISCGKRIDGGIGIVDDLIKPLVRSGSFKRLREPRYYCNDICVSEYHHYNEPIEPSPEEQKDPFTELVESRYGSPKEPPTELTKHFDSLDLEPPVTYAEPERIPPSKGRVWKDPPEEPEKGGVYHLICPECGWICPEDHGGTLKECPSCGASMDAKPEETEKEGEL